MLDLVARKENIEIMKTDRDGLTDTHVFLGLDGARGIAAIAVAVYHAHPLFDSQLFPGGYLAVDLFFVMSGAVIVHA